MQNRAEKVKKEKLDSKTSKEEERQKQAKEAGDVAAMEPRPVFLTNEEKNKIHQQAEEWVK